ncbi:MAG: phosphoglucosamine mutase, partial [Planctomycetes bacterium]|nr:phosphoglucosamine mutase [Planctomycetota bacterium]
MGLFGTDGIRGRYGDAPFDPVSLRRIGLAIGEVVRKQHQISRARVSQRVLIGRDTRESGPE